MRELDEEGFAIRPNKTRLKKELAAIHDLAVQLIDLPEKEKLKLGLNDKISAALQEARGMKASGAKNRLMKHITNLLAKEDLTSVLSYLDEKNNRLRQDNRKFHQLEQWRNRMIEEGDGALQSFVDEYPATDRQQVRQLLRAAQREHDTGKPPGAGKKLFRVLRDFAENK